MRKIRSKTGFDFTSFQQITVILGALGFAQLANGSGATFGKV
jgi:hypothetical protein